MSSPLAQFLERVPPSTDRPSDEEYVHAAMKEFLGATRSSEFRQRDTLTPERALTGGELDALHAVGLSSDAGVADDAEAARKEALYVFFRVFSSALPTRAVAELLGVDASRVRQRVNERTLLALRDGGEMRFPSAQFHAGRELPSLSAVLPALPPQIRPLEALSWLTTPSAELEDDAGNARSPRDFLLATGDAAPVVELARTLQRGEAT